MVTTIPVQFGGDPQFCVSFTGQNDMFAVSFDNLMIVERQSDVEHYQGEYNITPLVTSQIMQTRDKLMDDDVHIDMIPTRELQNSAGGVTFIVG